MARKAKKPAKPTKTAAKTVPKRKTQAKGR